MGDTGGFLSRLEDAKRRIEGSGSRSAVILHHDEADGLTSGALVKLSLESRGFHTELVCLDKLYPEIVADVESRPGSIIVYVDLGSGHIDLLSRNNRARNLVIVLDHHDTAETSDPLVMNLNPELCGFSGETDASSAVVAYMFGKTLDSDFAKYAHLALIGSVEVPGDVRGLNQIAATDAEKGGVARKTAKGEFTVEMGERSLARTRASTILNVLGSVGYYRDGPRIGIRACAKGLDDETVRMADSLEEKRREANRKMLSTIREKRLSQMKTVQWFHARDNYAGMSGKVVGSFCSYLRYQRGVNPVKYLVGMMNVPPDIPGWGNLPAPLVKVSARAPQPLVSMIERGTRPPLTRILPEACSQVRGFGDGHSMAASGVIPVRSEEKFLEKIDQLAWEKEANSTR